MEKTADAERAGPQSNPLRKRSAQWYPAPNRPHVIEIEIEDPDEYHGYGGYGGYGIYGRPPLDVDIIVEEDNYGRPPYYGPPPNYGEIY